jgi:hypothetical protein
MMDMPRMNPPIGSLAVLPSTGDDRLSRTIWRQCPTHCTADPEADVFKRLHALPPPYTLTAMQTLELSFCDMLQQLPSLASSTALQILKLCHVLNLSEVPPLGTVTALQTLELRACRRLQRVPSISTLTALQTLNISAFGDSFHARIACRSRIQHVDMEYSALCPRVART